MFIKDFDNTEKLYYIHSDYLGTIMALTNENGKKVEEYFYDAWGQRKNPANLSQNDTCTNLIIDRGYTGHEHWNKFNLINMNGRVYDPALGRFLSADPTYQTVEYSQGFNKYSYVLNNPFKYTDPTGYTFKPDGWDGEVIYTVGSFGNCIGNRYDFSNAYNNADTYFGWSNLYYNGVTKTSFGEYLSNGGQYELNGVNVLHGNDAKRWVADYNQKRYAQSNGGLTASLDYVGNLNGGRPPKISKYGDVNIGEQIIDWMIYISNNPNEDIYYNDMIAPDLFEQTVGYDEYKYHSYLKAHSGQDNSFGGVNFVIINPSTTNPNSRVYFVDPYIGINNFHINLEPECGNCSGVQIININFMNNSYYNDVFNIIY